MSERSISIPRLYGIVDAAFFTTLEELVIFARELTRGGCTLLQYRNKSGSARTMQAHMRQLTRFVNAEYIINDRADLCVACEARGLHIGQDDLSPWAARCIVGNERWLGISTHNEGQLEEADMFGDYLAIGPVFATSSKDNPDPVVGLEGVRRARALTKKPLVAIGGITRANAASVIEAGADSVAVISDLLREPRKSAEEFFRILR